MHGKTRPARCARQWPWASLGAAALVAALLAAVLGAVAPPAALASELDRQWTVEFTGGAMEDDGSADIAKAIGGMQPGDSAQFTVTLYEHCDKNADWYMENKVLRTMEETFQAAGGSYSYRLTYIDPTGQEKVLLTNEVVSGDPGKGNTQGLKDATEATGDMFFLDTLASGARARVVLTVGLDGETHGNTYFDSNAQVQLKFAAEPTTGPGKEGDGETKKPAPEPKKTTDKDEEKSRKTVLSQTGDPLVLGPIVVVAVLAVAVMVLLRRRAQRNDKEGETR